jgi:hypothetical protein
MWNGGGKVKRQSSEAGWWQGKEAELGEKVGGKVGR